MKKFLLAVAALACMGSVALAGPNAGGTIFVHDPSLGYNGPGNYCGQGVIPSDCEHAVTQHNGADYCVWKLYAAFKPCSAPRLKAIDFGVNYNAWPGDPTGLVILDHGNCLGDFSNGSYEYPGPGWPNPGSYDDVVFQYTQTTTLVEYYWFAGYAYYNGVGFFALGPGKDGGVFADDEVPVVLDPIVGYGTLGFNQPGSIVCPSAAAEGACCIGNQCTMTCESDCQGTWMGGSCDPNPCAPLTGACCINNVCYIMTQADCEKNGGKYLGDNSTCEGNPCAPTPVQTESWGKIKACYR